MSFFEAKQNAKREAEAKRRDLTVWAADMSEAVDDRLMADIIGDNLRNRVDVNSPEVAGLIAREKQRTAEIEREAAAKKAFEESIPKVVAKAGFDPSKVPEYVTHWAEKFLKDFGCVGPAAVALRKRFPNL
jgi:hypothetical protein